MNIPAESLPCNRAVAVAASHFSPSKEMKNFYSASLQEWAENTRSVWSAESYLVIDRSLKMLPTPQRILDYEAAVRDLLAAIDGIPGFMCFNWTLSELYAIRDKLKEFDK